MNRIFNTDSQRSDFLFQLSSLLGEGYSFSEAIQLYLEFTDGKRKKWVYSIYVEMQEGESFSEQLISGGFSKELISYLIFVERYGDFQNGLMQASIILRNRDELKKKIKKILHYPVFLLVGLIVIGTVMAEGVLPQFEQFFDAMGQDLPWISRWMLAFATWFQLPILITFVLIFLGIAFFFQAKAYF
ncbi:type II secretion system F family protein [Salipaludibacillus sp. HK11]|uniref:type II secretion system F family protein n=1 Tax=Salipaludibacillus sp. HK11 TaxID=3394320 RepID=UPI0039FDDB2B